MNKAEIAGMIDHTVLKPVATIQDVQKLCEEAKTHQFASVCVNPYYVPAAKKLLDGTTVKVCTVVGFPLGANSSKVKAFEAEQAVLEGATEIDMVVNIGALKAKDYETVKNDVIAVVQATKKANAGAIVKVIIETCLLTDEEKEKVCQILLETDAEFVKTSTGFSTGGATVEDLKLMKKVVGDKMQIKASGGVKNLNDFQACIAAGANRVGASSGIEIVSACQNE